MLSDLSFITATEVSFFAKAIQVTGMAGLLFIVWYLQRKSEDRRMMMIMKTEEKKWTQKFQEEREYRQQKFEDENAARKQQFDIFLNIMENVQLHGGLLTTAITLLNTHPRMFDEIKSLLQTNTDGLIKIHNRIDQTLHSSFSMHHRQHKDPT